MTQVRPAIQMPSSPEKYDQRDQAALRRAIQMGLDSVATVTGSMQNILVEGPASATDNAVVRFDLTTGKLVQNSVVIIGDTGIVTGVLTLTAGTLVATTRVTAPLIGTTTDVDVVFDRNSVTQLTLSSLLATFAGAVTANGVVTVAAGSATNALVVTTTGAIKGSFRHDASTRLDISVDATTGVATYALSVSNNANTRHFFPEAVEIASSGTTIRSTAFVVGHNLQGTTSPAQHVAIQATATHSGSGTVTNLVGLRTNPILGSGGGAITNAISQEVSALTATCTTAYGLLVQAITGGGTNYAIYTNAGLVRFGDAVNTTESYQVDGTKVVGNQGAAVADASGGATIDAEARTAINALLARVRTHGLIAT